jgi:hypothetical protein
MKKIFISLILVVTLTLSHLAYAWESANVHFALTGAKRDNTYFLCLPNIGCLSVLVGDHGKVYRIDHPFKVTGIFLTDVDDNFRLNYEGLPASCKVTVKTNQTLTITGHITPEPNKGTYISDLHCSLS